MSPVLLKSSHWHKQAKLNPNSPDIEAIPTDPMKYNFCACAIHNLDTVSHILGGEQWLSCPNQKGIVS
jgi:hypothetical protein